MVWLYLRECGVVITLSSSLHWNFKNVMWFLHAFLEWADLAFICLLEFARQLWKFFLNSSYMWYMSVFLTPALVTCSLTWIVFFIKMFQNCQKWHMNFLHSSFPVFLLIPSNVLSLSKQVDKPLISISGMSIVVPLFLLIISPPPSVSFNTWLSFGVLPPFHPSASMLHYIHSFFLCKVVAVLAYLSPLSDSFCKWCVACALVGVASFEVSFAYFLQCNSCYLQ